MEYRLQGRTFFDIGKALGVTPGRAHQLVDEALEATLQQPAAHLRALALARLEAVLTGVFSKAVNGDTKAVTMVLKIIDVVIDISQGIDHGGVVASQLALSRQLSFRLACQSSITPASI